nr:hypothetical protein [Tanacetum cinerariifolium]
MTSNRMFPVDFSGADVYGMMNCKQESTEVWHQRYGHLYVKGLQLLSNKDMVEGSRYFLLFVDDYSRMCWVYFLTSKSEAFEFFKKFKALTENQCNRKLKILRTDRGGEFLSNEFSRFCDEYGIKRELTAPYTPEQNGIAERKNRTIMEMARSMLKTKNLEDEFWAEAVATAVYLINISHTKAVWNVTPYEAWYESKPSVSNLRIFGCTCYAIIPSGRGKDVQFNKQEAWNTNSSSSTVTIEAQDEGKHEEQPTNTQNGQNSVDIPSGSITSKGSTSSGSISSESSQEDTDNEELQLRRSKRGNVPKRHFEVEGKSCAFALFDTDPTNAKSAINNEVWRRAMQEEFDAIERNETWKLAHLPQGKKAISLKWIFKTKFNSDGTIQKHKARLVARRYIQEHEIDYKETFSPVARFETVRVILALATQMQWTIFQFDVKSAFLNGELKEDVYVQQPEYFKVAREEHKVYKLKKALYGLKQAPRACMVGCKTVGTPMNVGEKLTSDDAKRILIYIAGITSYGIWYSRKEKFELVGYSDSDWAREKEDMKSTSGNYFTLGSGVVSWASKKQATVALSSTEAEYVAATKAACQAIWLRRMLSDLNQTQNDATTILCDNMSAIAMTRNHVLHHRTKHIAIKHHFIRELVAKRQVELEFCRTDQQLADLFTKSLSRGKFE